MTQPFTSVHYHALAPDDPARAQGPVFRGSVSTPGPDALANEVSAARYYLSQVLGGDARHAVRSVAAAGTSELVPDLFFSRSHDGLPQRGDHLIVKRGDDAAPNRTRIVRFEQRKWGIPVFGTSAVVELGRDRRLISIDAELADLGTISHHPSTQEREAKEAVARHAGVDPADLRVPEAVTKVFYFPPEEARWRLAYLFRNVSVATPSSGARDGHGLAASPRSLYPEINYLVDAHVLTVLLAYPATPTLTLLSGSDELGVHHQFDGQTEDDSFEMADPRRRIKTFDLGFREVGTLLPDRAVYSKSADWEDTNSAAVSAHVNAHRVYDFYNEVLQRRGIDDNRMEFISVVNCTYPPAERPPQWRNACWWRNCMWYGQVTVTGKGGKERLHSMARHLDIAAHEITHGLTETTANLVYAGQSGALNESVSDIFGVIINNWYDHDRPVQERAGSKRQNTSTWCWTIGEELGQDGGPLRDLERPSRTGAPEHMDAYRPMAEDYGGVHTFSSIHNKAAHVLLTSSGADGQPALRPEEVALLYYQALLRLHSLAGFADMLQGLCGAATTYYAGNPTVRDAKIASIENAYRQVGISLPGRPGPADGATQTHSPGGTP